MRDMIRRDSREDMIIRGGSMTFIIAITASTAFKTFRSKPTTAFLLVVKAMLRILTSA